MQSENIYLESESIINENKTINKNEKANSFEILILLIPLKTKGKIKN